MGRYVTKTDVENIFGMDNVVVWSNLEGGTAVNETRIAQAILYAESIIEDSFRGGRYQLPFSPVSVVLKDWCAKLAGIWLFSCRPHYKKDREAAEGFMDLRKMVFEEIVIYHAGQRVFDCNKAATKDVNSPTAIT